jgi:hypothetical protein
MAKSIPDYGPHAFRTKAESISSYEQYAKNHKNLAESLIAAAAKTPHASLKKEWLAEAKAECKLAEQAERAADKLR